MNTITEKEGVRDARELGMPKYIILGMQHLFAMFGATILVPVLTGLSVSSTLLFAGIGTFQLLAECVCSSVDSGDCHRCEVWRRG